MLFVALIAVRLRQAARPERRELVPVAIAAAAFAALSIIDALGRDRLGRSHPAAEPFDMAIPLSFLIAVAVRRVQRALAVESLLDPQRLASVNAVGRALAGCSVTGS